MHNKSTCQYRRLEENMMALNSEDSGAFCAKQFPTSAWKRPSQRKNHRLKGQNHVLLPHHVQLSTGSQTRQVQQRKDVFQDLNGFFTSNKPKSGDQSGEFFSRGTRIKPKTHECIANCCTFLLWSKDSKADPGERPHSSVCSM